MLPCPGGTALRIWMSSFQWTLLTVGRDVQSCVQALSGTFRGARVHAILTSSLDLLGATLCSIVRQQRPGACRYGHACSGERFV